MKCLKTFLGINIAIFQFYIEMLAFCIQEDVRHKWSVITVRKALVHTFSAI